MRLRRSGLYKKYDLFVGTSPETHRLELVLLGNEDELREFLNTVYLKCLGEVKVKQTPLSYNQ